MAATARNTGLIRSALLVTLCTISHSIAAQGAAPLDAPTPSRADPLDPQAPVPAVNVPTALTGYRRLAGAPPIAWPQANETVNRIGGWRAYARETQQPDAPQPSPGLPSTPATDTAPVHHHHPMH